MGRGPAVEELVLSEVSLNAVVDENGRTSFDALSQPGPGAPRNRGEPALSPAALAGTQAPARREGQSRPCRARPGPGRAGQGVEGTVLRWRLLRARGHAGSGGLVCARGARVRPQPRWTSMSNDERARYARGPADERAYGSRSTRPRRSRGAAFDLRVLEQTLVPTLRIDNRLHAEATARFDPAAGQERRSRSRTRSWATGLRRSRRPSRSRIRATPSCATRRAMPTSRACSGGFPPASCPSPPSTRTSGTRSIPWWPARRFACPAGARLPSKPRSRTSR